MKLATNVRVLLSVYLFLLGISACFFLEKTYQWAEDERVFERVRRVCMRLPRYRF